MRIAQWAFSLLIIGINARAADADKPAPAPQTWTVVGQQGMVRMVLVPLAQQGDESAYRREIAALCGEQMNCFLNFYTNSTGATVALPLPDVIDHEATAVYRRSYKKGVPVLQWSCRMQRAESDCF